MIAFIENYDELNFKIIGFFEDDKYGMPNTSVPYKVIDEMPNAKSNDIILINKQNDEITIIEYGYESVEEAYYTKLSELKLKCDQKSKGTFLYDGLEFDADTDAKLRMLRTKEQLSSNPELGGIEWSTSGGKSTYMITINNIKPFIDACDMMELNVFAMFRNLEAQLNSIDIESETAIEQIKAIVWE